MPSYQYRDSHVKDKTVSPTILSLTWESPYLEKMVSVLRWGQAAAVLTQCFCITTKILFKIITQQVNNFQVLPSHVISFDNFRGTTTLHVFSTALVGSGSGQWLIAAEVALSTQPEAVYGSIRNRFMKFKLFQHCSVYFRMQTFGAWISCAAVDVVSGWVNVLSEYTWLCVSMVRESRARECISGWLIDKLVDCLTDWLIVTQSVR